MNLQDVCTYLSPAASPPQTLGAVGIGSSSPRDQPLHPSFPSPRKQPHHPSFSAPEGPATLSCHLPPYMNTEHAQSWPSINVSRKKNDENYIRQLIDSPAVQVGRPTQCRSQKRMHGEKKKCCIMRRKKNSKPNNQAKLLCKQKLDEEGGVHAVISKRKIQIFAKIKYLNKLNIKNGNMMK